MIIRKKMWRRFFFLAVTGFILINIIAAFHAWKFTHFNTASAHKTADPGKLSTGQKLKTLFFGISHPRPENKQQPAFPFEVVSLQSNKKIECWYIKTDTPAYGTVILFHGYGGDKSSMLDKAGVFLKLGYHVLLADFMGSGGSEGNQTTIGYKEAEQVKTCYDYVSSAGEQNIYFFGTSMGAVAIMKAMKDYPLEPKGLILECPFGTLYQTVKSRFRSMRVPAFPMAGLLVFWGGTLNGFRAFDHKPVVYACHITSPVLLLYGGKDEKVSREETDNIFRNLQGPKQLKVYEDAGHENYLLRYKEQWSSDVQLFLKELR